MNRYWYNLSSMIHRYNITIQEIDFEYKLYFQKGNQIKLIFYKMNNNLLGNIIYHFFLNFHQFFICL